jgi:nitrilase
VSGVHVAAVQLASGPNPTANLAETERLLGLAAERGAGLVVLPEHFALLGCSAADTARAREPEGEGPIQDFLSRQARAHRVWLCGSVPLAAAAIDKFRASSLLYDEDGRLAARYDKIHLFDATIDGDASGRYAESQQVEAGDAVQVVDTPAGRLGLAASYDLRFPELFRIMAARGAEIIALPAAFTAITGRAHWETLVRARAIENLSYVIAAAQGGFHVSGRETHGDSMIVDPWGNVLGRLPKGSGVIVRPVDVERLHNIRRGFPTLQHVRIRCEC